MARTTTSPYTIRNSVGSYTYVTPAATAYAGLTDTGLAGYLHTADRYDGYNISDDILTLGFDTLDIPSGATVTSVDIYISYECISSAQWSLWVYNATTSGVGDSTTYDVDSGANLFHGQVSNLSSLDLSKPIGAEIVADTESTAVYGVSLYATYTTVPTTVNKVEYGDETLIDLTSDTVTADSMLSGATAHDNSGSEITGTITNKGNAVVELDPQRYDGSSEVTLAAGYYSNVYVYVSEGLLSRLESI